MGFVMKTALPLIALLVAAQSNAAYGSSKVDRFSVGLTYADVSHDVLEYDGFTLDARVKVVDNFAFRLALTDARTGDLRATVNSTTYTFGLDARRHAFGGELTVPFTNNSLTFSLDFAGATLEGTATDGINSASGELVDNTQVVLGVRYVHEFGAGMSLGLGVSHYINDLSLKNGLDAIYTVKDNSTTAPSIALAWAPTPGFSLQVAYSTEDTLLGIPDADGTVSVTLRVNF
jgi:hypothetical protein